MQHTNKPQADFDLDRYLAKNPEKAMKILSIFVINHIQEIVSTVISTIKKNGKTYEEISKILKINRSTLFRIEKGQYWPKNSKKQNEIIEKILDLV